MQTCIDYRNLAKILCQPLNDEPLEYCIAKMADVGIDCADEFAALYDCWISKMSAAMECYPPELAECVAKDDAADLCAWNYGCNNFDPTCTISSTPSIKLCKCDKGCVDGYYYIDCFSDLTVTNCDCFIDNVLIGTCQEPGDPICDVRYGCCNQYFNLPQWPK
jgi:hypothetical protein